MILKGIAQRLIQRAVENKLASVVGTTTAAVGFAAVVDPALLEMIPVNLRGYAVLLVIVTMCVRSVMAEVIDVIKAEKGADVHANVNT